MRKIALVTLDLDGTLLDSEKRLSAENARALEKAAAEGIEIVPATGRFYRGMPDVIRSLPYVHYVIGVNGAEVWDVRQEKAVCASELSWERSVEIMEYLDTLPVIYDCYMDGWGWMTRASYERAAEFAATPHSLDMILRLRTPVDDLKEHLKKTRHGIQKIQMFFKDMDLRARMIPALQERFPDTVVTTSVVNNVEINSREANKGTALKKLAAYLGLPREETMAFGDDLNDVTMLREAGIGVAMGNASDTVKKAADHVTADCDHAGVAKALDRFIWGKEK